MNLILYPGLNRLLTPGLPNATNLLYPQADKLLEYRLRTDVIARPAICFCLHLHSLETDRIEASRLDPWSGYYWMWIALTLLDRIATKRPILQTF